jgi:hypothetical protein
MLRYVFCPDPDCGHIAEITDRFDLRATDGVVPHVVTFCIRRHIFRLPASQVTSAGLGHSVIMQYAYRND